jgi:hypothetical protein
MQLSLQNNHYQDAQRVVRFIDGLKNIFLVIKDLFGFMAALGIGLVLWIPINGILEYLVYRLKKSKPIDLDNVAPNVYRQLRQRHDDLEILLIPLNEIADKIEGKKAEIPFLFRWTTNIIVKSRKILVKQYVQDTKSFESLAAKQTTYKGFERLTEAQLWNERAKTYEYLI